METQTWQRRKRDPARSQIGFGERARDVLRGPPDRKRGLSAGLGIGIRTALKVLPVFSGNAAMALAGRVPQTALDEGGDHVALVATGMAAHQHFGQFDPALIASSGLIGHGPGSAPSRLRARLVPAKGFGDGFSGHGAPRHRSVLTCAAQIIRGGEHFSAPPFGQDAEEAGDRVEDLPRILVVEVAAHGAVAGCRGCG